jgi:hypothetical protein
MWPRLKEMLSWTVERAGEQQKQECQGRKEQDGSEA